MHASFSQSLFQSRIGRRILGLFVLCAVVPTSILGWVSYRQVTEQLIVQTSARLKQESKSQGMVLYSYLLTVKADLDRIARRAAARWNRHGRRDTHRLGEGSGPAIPSDSTPGCVEV